MTVFKAFLKVLYKYKATVIMYTVILILFAGFNMKSSDTNSSFVASKPDVLIINNDEFVGITKNLIDYITDKTNIVQVDDDESAIADALFYRDVNYIIYIPEGFREEFLNSGALDIAIQSTGDYQASLAALILDRYLNVASVYKTQNLSEEELINNINEILSREVEVEVTSKLDNVSLAKSTLFYNFVNYSFLASAIFIICLVLSSFREEKIDKRNIISSIPYQKFNKYLLLSNALFAIVLWLFYVILSMILLGDIMFTYHGLLYIINSFVFMGCAVTVACLIGNVVRNKDAVNGIVNVIALGSSFLCGAFVPMEFLPESVLNIAHILPSYWFIKNNEFIKTLEVFNMTNLKPFMINLVIIVIFILAFVIINNIITKRKRKIN